MNLIVAADKKWGIGKDGKLLVSIPEDMKLFRQETEGKVVVMGRKTFESLPQKHALTNRINIVLTSDKTYKDRYFATEGVVVLNSVEETLEYLSSFDSDDVYIIGGEQVYKEFLPYCNTAHVTRIDYIYDADTFFPDLDKDNSWQITMTSEEHTYFDICYEFKKYSRIQ